MKKAKTFSQCSVFCFCDPFLGNSTKKCLAQTEYPRVPVLSYKFLNSELIMSSLMHANLLWLLRGCAALALSSDYATVGF
jgi:hypothetical protein